MEYIVRQRSKPALPARSRLPVYSEYDQVRKRCSNLLNETAFVAVAVYYVAVFFLVVFSEVHIIPAPKSIESIRNVEKEFRGYHFSEERARNFMNELSSIGPKPTGSYENEILAVDYLLRQLNHIKNSAKHNHRIEIDVQKPSGCFPMEYVDCMTSCYRKVKNIIAKISSPQTTKPVNRSLLINCHFDSAPTSPGASDDVVNCAVMLEVLLALSQHSKPLDHSVIFLFNGAEENFLQASHGFISQHPWAKEVVGFVNLEAGGAGGKELLFQADREHNWLVRAYADSAKHPFGSVVAQDVFQSGLIPSDTDYRIFRDFGRIPGLDFAYIRNGYVYHTKYDSPEFVSPGSIQQAGENILGLIHAALKSTAMTNPSEQSHRRLVYFDFLGLFMIAYPVSFVSFLNLLTIFLTACDICLRINRTQSGANLSRELSKIILAFLVIMGSLLVAMATTSIIALILSALGHTMSWYNRPYWIVGLYLCPSLAAIISTHWLAVTRRRRKHFTDDWNEEEVFYDAVRVFWILLLQCMSIRKLLSTFLCCAWILYPTIIRAIGRKFIFAPSSKGPNTWWLPVHLGMQTIALALTIYTGWLAYIMFVPIMGRMGCLTNPDLFIGILTALQAFLCTTYTMTVIQVTKSVGRLLSMLMTVTLLTMGLVIFTSLGFPYSADSSGPAPQRYYILHTARTFYNSSSHVIRSDAGYWVVPLDFNGPSSLYPYIPEMKNLMEVDCEAELNCGMPYYFPVLSKLRKTYFVPAPEPKIHTQRKFTLMSQKLVKVDVRRLTFRVMGPDHMTIVLCPHTGVEAVQWSLTSGEPLQNLKWQHRPTYFIYYSHGEELSPWEFWVDLKVSQDRVQQPLILDVAFQTHYLHGHDFMSEEFSAFLDRIPPWVHAVPWTATYDFYSF